MSLESLLLLQSVRWSIMDFMEQFCDVVILLRNITRRKRILKFFFVFWRFGLEYNQD